MRNEGAGGEYLGRLRHVLRCAVLWQLVPWSPCVNRDLPIRAAKLV